MNSPVMPVVLVGLVLFLFVVALTLVARRLDRLHTALLKSRRALEHALTARAQAAHDFAACGALDVAGSLLLAESADSCLRLGMDPLVDDGLEALEAFDEQPVRGAEAERTAMESALSRMLRLTVDELVELEGLDASGLGASAGVSTIDGLEQAAVPALNVPTSARPALAPPFSQPSPHASVGESGAGESGARNARSATSEAADQAELAGGGNTPNEGSLTPEQMAIFSQLQRARLDVKMTRSFHNSHVDQARRLRRNPLVRAFRLAGGAAMPLTVDMDDE